MTPLIEARHQSRTLQLGTSPRFFCEKRALSWELAAAHAVRCYHYFMPVLAILDRARVAA